MTDPRPLITPQTKVGDLLKDYPELQEVLIEIAPAFKKLRNPVLLRTVARVTSLAQAARVGGVPIGELVRRLRSAAGQPEYVENAGETEGAITSATAPDWYSLERIRGRFDARALIDSGEQPIGRVLSDLERLTPGGIYELITPFEPAPLMDKAAARGLQVWSRPVAPAEYHTAFFRP